MSMSEPQRIRISGLCEADELDVRGFSRVMGLGVDAGVLCGLPRDHHGEHEDWRMTILELRKTLAAVREALRKARDWEDVDDEWSEDIKAAHPARTHSYFEYETAMKMVGHRHSKGELVALVTWLLAQLSQAK